MGPSGSGKSTLLYMLGGLERPTTGNIFWPALGPAQSLRPAKIAFVFQSQSLLAVFNSVENVELPLLLSGASAEQARRAALAALERLDLLDIAEKLPEDLSGGQAQRVGTARALAAGAKLILADEPTGQLDHQTANKFFDALLDALDDSDVALVVATHDPSIANRMRDLWRLEHGVLHTAPSA